MNPTHRAIASILVLLGVFAACSRGADKPAMSGGAMPSQEVDVITVTSGSATLTQDLPGRLQAYRTAEVRAQVEGIVEKRLFVEGSDVKEGATLFQIDPRNYAAAVNAAEADVEAARLVLERYAPLLESGFVSQQEYDAAAAALKQVQATLTRAQIDLENTRVPAPIPGRIGRAMVTEGALVGRGEATPLATIEQVDPIYANFTQPGAELLRLQRAVKEGTWKRAESAQVELILEDGTVYPLPGTLLFSDLAVDSSTGSVSMRAKFPNPRYAILPGMFVRIRFPEAIAVDSIRVPQRAVQGGTQGQYVMVVSKDGKVAMQAVKTSGMAGGDFIVTEGLNAGEQVIVNGLQKVRPGSQVKAVPWTMQPDAAAPASGTAKSPNKGD